MGDFGGVAELITIFWVFMLSPISEYLFNLKALEKMFLAKTSDQDVLLPTKLKKKNSKNKYLTKKI